MGEEIAENAPQLLGNLISVSASRYINMNDPNPV
jgi:hypothetical protein